VLRARLGKYLSLQAAASRLNKAAKSGDNGAIFAAICAYIQIALPEVSSETIALAPWYEVISAVADIGLLNAMESDFAILKIGQGGKNSPVPWDYDDRLCYFWVHLLARSYHWTREQIEDLWPEEAIAFIQEVLAHDQYEREFAHSLSEVSYHYDKGAKTSKYVPLHRPAWMVLRDPKTLITRMHKHMMPMGVVIYPGQEEVVH